MLGVCFLNSNGTNVEATVIIINGPLSLQNERTNELRAKHVLSPPLYIGLQHPNGDRGDVIRLLDIPHGHYIDVRSVPDLLIFINKRPLRACRKFHGISVWKPHRWSRQS